MCKSERERERMNNLELVDKKKALSDDHQYGRKCWMKYDQDKWSFFNLLKWEEWNIEPLLLAGGGGYFLQHIMRPIWTYYTAVCKPELAGVAIRAV